MREILFKAKRLDNGEWVEGHLLKYDDNKARICESKTDIFCYEKDESIIQTVAHYVDPETICQYTGLKDSKDNKVFEGDIIKYADRYDHECYVESLEAPEEYEGCDYSDIFTTDKVVYGTFYSYPAFDLDNHNFECNALSELNNGDWRYEVIGNIFDNPELLEVTE